MALIQHTPILQHAVTSDLFSMNIVNEEFGNRWPIPWNVYALRSFKASWKRVEPIQGAYTFSDMDFLMSLAEKENIELLFIHDGFPTWSPDLDSSVSNITAFQAYIKQVATRYQSRITYYEQWNEPESIFLGRADDLITFSQAMYNEVKSIDPDNVVISPAININTGIKETLLNEYLTLGGGALCDVIGFHSYVAPNMPETMIPRIQIVRNAMQTHGLTDKPLWNTETGWNIINHDQFNAAACGTTFAGAALTDEDANAYICRAHIISWLYGVERFYWYSYGHRCMGFTEHDGNAVKSSATAYRETQRWLIGRKIISATEDTISGVWVIELLNIISDTSEYIIWTTGTPDHYKLDRTWRINKIDDLYGKSIPFTVKTRDRFRVTGSPQRLYQEKGSDRAVTEFFL